MAESSIHQGHEPEKIKRDIDVEKQREEITSDLVNDRLNLQPIESNVTAHDIHPVADQYTEMGDEIYDRFSPHRKIIMTGVLSFCGFLAPISSTAVLAAIPEVAKTYNSTGTIINLSNALYLVFMGLSPVFWGPLGQVYGRRITQISAAGLFFVFSIGTALAPNLASYFVFRILTAFQGTAFLIVGASCIGDIYRPTERGTALGWFLSGTLIGPAFGPFIGGIIVTFQSWRVVFWLQTALAGVGFSLCVIFLPETIHHKKSADMQGLTKKQYAGKMWQSMNPFRVIKLFRYPNLLVVSLASSALVWNMYSLLTPIRYVLNPRFHLTSPIQSGLFYIAPGCGYILGTFFGGRWADYTVRKWIKIRGQRVPEDRLRSSILAMGAIIPACILIYGWSIEKAVGGIPLPVIVMFLQGVAQLFCFPSLNTYCLDVMHGRSSEVVAGNYMVRYFFGAFGTAVVLPAVEKIGVGWFSTISALFLVVSTVAVHVTTLYGKGWREGIDEKRQARKEVRNSA
ncbi:MFS general substrate transporter [Venturia nashicola]|uniref:MFS general substrate transporter n=1 Tax=Venturia nashicola TaxID=86259 RepID=A0A4Z1P6K5_9PEZI|nr:MFS general substrate transporter [Venturia nashicola]